MHENSGQDEVVRDRNKETTKSQVICRIEYVDCECSNQSQRVRGKLRDGSPQEDERSPPNQGDEDNMDDCGAK